MRLERIGVDEEFLVEARGEGGGDLSEVGFLTEFRDVDENNFGFERLVVEKSHGLKIEIITEVATGVFGDDGVEAGHGETLGELREIDLGVIGDAIIATDSLEANS